MSVAGLWSRIYFWFLWLALILAQSTFASQEAVQTFSLDGRLYSDAASTQPLLDESILIKVQILAADQQCMLYEESHTVSTASSAGYFSVRIGSVISSAKRTENDSGHAMSRIFSNTGASVIGRKLSDLSTCNYSPVAGDARLLRVQIKPHSDGIWRTLEPLMPLDSVPSALVAERAETFQGLQPNDFVLTNSDVSQSHLNNVFSSANYPRLLDLLSGGSLISSIVAGPGLTGGTISSGVKTIGIDTGTAANKIVQLDGDARLPAVDASALLNLDASKISSGTLSELRLPGTVLLDGGNFSAASLKVGARSDHDLIFLTNDSSRLTVDKNGSVGIGTASPGVLLDVNGIARVETHLITPHVTSAAGGLLLDTNSHLSDITLGNSYMVVKSGGNVGIGTMSPLDKLHVVGGGIEVDNANYVSAYGVGMDSSSANAKWTAYYTSQANGAVFLSGGKGTYANAQNDINFAKWDGSTLTKLMTIQASNGNVGVGTTTPGAMLDVAGHIANSGATASVGTCGTTPAISGNDMRGQVTLGTGSPTACTVTFATAYATAPHCVVTAYGGDPGAVRWWISTTTTTLVMNFSATPTASQKFEYHCVQ